MEEVCVAPWMAHSSLSIYSGGSIDWRLYVSPCRTGVEVAAGISKRQGRMVYTIAIGIAWVRDRDYIAEDGVRIPQNELVMRHSIKFPNHTSCSVAVGASFGLMVGGVMVFTIDKAGGFKEGSDWAPRCDKQDWPGGQCSCVCFRFGELLPRLESPIRFLHPRNVIHDQDNSE